MTIDAPVVLYVAPVVAAGLAGLALWARRVRVRHAARWSADLGERSRRANRFGAIPVGLAALAALVALSGPRWGRRTVTAESRALDLVVAVDVSRSMLAEDAQPSRLGRARIQVRRLVQDLRGDRIGLIAFAGRSFILSPLSGDVGALELMSGGLDPDVTSSQGTDLAAALRQGRGLLLADNSVADRILVVFTDGEAHDTLSDIVDAARALKRDGIHLILVAEGGVTPVPIPVRNAADSLIGYLRDADGQTVGTSRRDDILTAVADAAEGALVPAGLDDQAGAVRRFVAGYKRIPQSTTTTSSDVPRGWIPALAAVLLLLLATLTRRTAALAGLLLMLGAPALRAQGPTDHAADAWRRGDLGAAAVIYLQRAQARGTDTAWYNAGTAALAVGAAKLAASSLGRAAKSLDPTVRFRALYNLGLLDLRLAVSDSAQRDTHLEDARRALRDALLLRPGDRAAKWNYELALVPTPPPSGGGGSPPPPQGGGSGQPNPPPGALPQLSRAQAEQILQSIAAEERQTLKEQNARRGPARTTSAGPDW